jgi:hypothetical protein
MNLKHRRVAVLAAALTVVSALAACGSADEGAPSDGVSRQALDAPSGPGSFLATGDANGRAYVTQMRSEQASGRSTNPALVALTDEQLLALGQTTCTAKKQGATSEQIQDAVAEGMSGVSGSEVAPYVSSAIKALCNTG